jgi:type II secretory pathway predicted ATPase ExeA
MGKPEPISVIRSVAEPVAAAVAATSPRPFAGDSAGSGYFESDHHHRYIATAIFRELAKGHGLVLLCGEHAADVDLVERFLNEEGRDRYRASLVRCRPEMDFGTLVRSYNRRLGLRQEAGSDGIWALLSHLMAEVRKGVRRLLVLENAESLDLTCFDELLRFMRLDEPHVMPVVLLGSADFAERLATPAFGFLNSAITGRVPFDRVEQEEVGAFLHYQLNILPGNERALFPPEIVNLIAVRAGGSAAVINRLALDVLEQGRRDAAPVAPPEPAPAIAVVPPAEEVAPEPAEEPELSEASEPAEPLKAEPLKAESSEAETLEAEAAEVEATEADAAEAEPVEAEPVTAAEPPPRLVAGGRQAISTMTGTKEKRRARLSVRSGLALYVVAAVLAGLGLLYVLAPRGQAPSATIASSSGSAETPIVAAPEKSSAAAPTVKAAPSDAAAAQAAAVEPAAGPPATPPASAPEAASDQNGPVVIGAKIVPFTAPAPPASDAASTPAAPEPTASASTEPSSSAHSEPSASASSEPAASATSEPAAPPPPPVASAAPNPPAAPAAPVPAPASEAAAQPAAPAPSEAAASSEAASAATPKAGTSTASQPVPAASQPASPAPAPAAQAAAPGAMQAIAPLAALEPAKVPTTQEPSQPQPPNAAHPSAELTLLVQRGDELLAAGDIYSARQFYERAAQAGDPAAQCGLGKSYDPVFLRRLGARGVAGDAATAVQWYRRAAAGGNNEAAARLARLDSADPNRSNSK